MTELSLALIQFAPKLGDLNDNFRRHLTQLHTLRAEGVKLAVFPELSLTGYQLQDLVAEVALTRDELIQGFSSLGPGPEIEFVVGYMEHSHAVRCYNAMAHLRLETDGTLRLLHNHRKLNLPTYGMFEEQRYFSRGNRLAAYDSPLLGRTGLLICEDLWHASNPLLLALDGPELEGATTLIIGSNSPTRGLPQEQDEPDNAVAWDFLARSTSITHNCLVLVCQRSGVEDGFVFTGGSEIVAPGGKRLARAPLFESETLRHSLNLEHLLKQRRGMMPGGPADDYDLLVRELARIKKSAFRGSAS